MLSINQRNINSKNFYIAKNSKKINRTRLIKQSLLKKPR